MCTHTASDNEMVCVWTAGFHFIGLKLGSTIYHFTHISSTSSLFLLKDKFSIQPGAEIPLRQIRWPNQQLNTDTLLMFSLHNMGEIPIQYFSSIYSTQFMPNAHLQIFLYPSLLNSPQTILLLASIPQTSEFSILADPDFKYLPKG